jgi:hypothetical protein
MRLILWLLVAAALQRPESTSRLMIDTIYPTSDALFYIETRTPANDPDWKEFQTRMERLSEAAVALTSARYARDREQWQADAKLLVEVSNKAIAAAKKRDVDGLVALNDELYESCTSCHKHYRPNYGRGRAG